MLRNYLKVALLAIYYMIISARAQRSSKKLLTKNSTDIQEHGKIQRECCNGIEALLQRLEVNHQSPEAKSAKQRSLWLTQGSCHQKDRGKNLEHSVL